MQPQIIKSKRTKLNPIKKDTVDQSKTKILHWLIENPYLAQRELNNRRFFYFVRWAWSEISSEKLEINWHMEYICDTCQAAVERVGMNLPKLADIDINVPPGSTKTSIVAILLNVWCWTRWHWMKFITVTYGSDLSIESADKTRDVVRSDKFQAIYPELEIKQDKEAIGNFRIIKKDYVVPGKLPRVQYGGTRLSTSVGAKVTGFHGHVIIVDDPIDPDHAYSKGQIDSTNRWLDQTLSTRKINKAVTLTITIMQRVAQNDPTGHHLAQPGLKINHICLPGEIFNGSENVKPQELISKYKDGLLDPVRLSFPILEEMKAKLGQYGYAGQVLQTPTPPSGGMFKVDHLNIIERMPPDVDIIEIVRYWDKAGTKEQADGKGKACYTVGTKMAKLVRNRFVIIDVKRGRWASEEREAIIKSTAQADGIKVKIYHEQEPGSGGKQSAEATNRNLAGFAVYADLPHGDKVYRADPFSVQVNSGTVSILRGEWNNEYIEELRNFPFSTYKDQVDSSSGAFSKLTANRMVEVY